jgi:hypothetical protein
MPLADLNLAGFSLLSLLALFFPGVGLIEHRKRRREQWRRYERGLDRIMLDEAGKIIEERDRERSHDEITR